VGYDSLLSGLAVSHVSEKPTARNFRTDLGHPVQYMQSGTAGGLPVIWFVFPVVFCKPDCSVSTV